jgi:hypothetical protein
MPAAMINRRSDRGKVRIIAVTRIQACRIALVANASAARYPPVATGADSDRHCSHHARHARPSAIGPRSRVAAE